MQNHFSGGSAARWIFAGALTLTVSFAAETRFWQQGDKADFEKGTSRKLSLRSDGRLMLAPTLTEVFDSPSPYLWAAVVDASGTVYTAGGGSGSSGVATLFAIGRDGKSRTVAELQGLEIHALAVDRSNRVYAATDPDGRVYRIGAGGKAELFYDPHTKYIWALAFNRQGDLFVATGDPGEIHRVTPDGKGSVFFKTDEAHARSLAIDADGNLIVGTEPGGLVVRVSTSGQGFVLYQTSKREVTAVTVGAHGDIYAAASGNKTAPAPVLNVPTPPQFAPPPVGAAPAASPVPAAPPPSFTPFGVGSPIAGGSEVYRIDRDGAPRKLWTNAQDIVYAIAFDAAGHPLLGTGNHGRIYRLDSDVLHTLLVDTSPTQITGFAPGPQGSLYAVTGNIGRLYRIGPDLEKTGTFESEVFDAGSFAWWGRLALHGTTAGVVVSTRSGNLNRPQNNWSAWSPLQPGGRVASPPARFLQYKLELSAAAEVTEVEVAWLAKNVPPVIEEIEVAPPNYKFPANTAGFTAPSASITLPPMGQHRKSSSPSSGDLGSQTLSYAKGSLGARWSATDENGDTLTYKVEIRGVNEADWKPLKDKLRERYVSWDSTGFPDGEYVLRVTASDAPSNPPGQALSATLVSDPFTIDNTPPSISGLTASRQSARIEVRWTARDALSNIGKAEYSVDGGDWLIIEPVTRLSDALVEEYRLVVDAGAGEHVVAVRVSDEFDNQAVDKIVVK